jgi:hypothetical protein
MPGQGIRWFCWVLQQIFASFLKLLFVRFEIFAGCFGLLRPVVLWLCSNVSDDLTLSFARSDPDDRSSTFLCTVGTRPKYSGATTIRWSACYYLPENYFTNLIYLIHSFHLSAVLVLLYAFRISLERFFLLRFPVNKWILLQRVINYWTVLHKLNIGMSNPRLAWSFTVFNVLFDGRPQSVLLAARWPWPTEGPAATSRSFERLLLACVSGHVPSNVWLAVGNFCWVVCSVSLMLCVFHCRIATALLLLNFILKLQRLCRETLVQEVAFHEEWINDFCLYS